MLDAGCGPGFVSTDLAEQGVHVLASDGDQKSLDVLDARRQERGLSNIRAYPACDVLELPEFEPNPTVAYMRWLLCYLGVEKTETLFRNLSRYPGIRLLIHDFINYRSARLVPSSEAVQLVIGGFYREMKDADIGFALPAILERCGFKITWKRIVTLAAAPNDLEWSWPDEFFRLHIPRLKNSEPFSEAFFRDWNLAAENPGAFFCAWPVLQLVAVKR